MNYDIARKEIERNFPINKILKKDGKTYTVASYVACDGKGDFIITVVDENNRFYTRKIFGNCFITVNKKILNFGAA